MSGKFNNSIVLITGGLGDIGRAIILEFAKHGASIAIADIIDSKSAKPFLDDLIRTFGAKCLYNQLDVTNANATKSWIDEVHVKLGVPTVIISNAACVTQKSILEINADQWKRELDVNLNGMFNVVQAASLLMTNSNTTGNIVMIGSWAAHKVHREMPAYSVSKAAVRMLCKCFALELAPFGITVNELAPGYVQAGLSAKVWNDNPGRKQEAIEKVPLKSLITVDEIAQQVLFLSDAQNKHITGTTFLMDGGLSLL